MKQYQIDRIKDLMEAKGISNQELATMCEMSAMTVNRLLTKTDYNPTTDTVEKIAEALGVHEYYIYEPEGETQSKVPLNGYIEYDGDILRIKTFTQLERIYQTIKSQLEAPQLAKRYLEREKENQKTQSKKPIDITTIDLFKHERYDTSEIYTWSFRKSEDEKEEILNDLGNMCKGYPFKVCGERFLNSECAYISGMFSQNTPKAIDIQRELQESDNGYEAKKAIRRKYEQVGFSREDWNSYNVQWMLYVVWQKVTQNKDFAAKLKKIPSYAMIVENSTFQKGETSEFWGMKNIAFLQIVPILEAAAKVKNFSAPKKDVDKAKMEARNSVNHLGVWEGVNCMGKILTICKHCLEDGTQPPIDYDLLRSKQIYLFGKLLTFEAPLENKQKHTPTVIFDFDKTLVDTLPLDEHLHLLKGKKRMSQEWNDAMKEYLSHLSECKVYDGVNEVMDYIRAAQIKVIVVTDSIKAKVKEAAKLYGWSDIIKDKNTFGRHSYGMQKIIKKDEANPILFEKALSTVGVEAKDCISFGNEYNDALAAQKIGIRAYNCLWGATKADADLMLSNMQKETIAHPLEIIKIIKGEAK